MHDFAAERREPAMLRGVERGVGPVERDVVRERHVARAHVVVRAQQRERVLDRVSALEAEQRADLPRLEAGLDLVGGERPLELGILRDHAARDVDLLELHAGVAWLARHVAIRLVRRIARLAGDVDGPELRADVACFQAREIGHARRSLVQIVRVHVVRMRRCLRECATGRSLCPSMTGEAWSTLSARCVYVSAAGALVAPA